MYIHTYEHFNTPSFRPHSLRNVDSRTNIVKTILLRLRLKDYTCVYKCSRNEINDDIAIITFPAGPRRRDAAGQRRRYILTIYLMSCKKTELSYLIYQLSYIVYVMFLLGNKKKWIKKSLVLWSPSGLC